jgi:ubiquinone/menaquinone biosynthesis C-methylase UbiE
VVIGPIVERQSRLADAPCRAYLRDVPGDPRDDDAKAWLAGVFDRAAPTYDRVGEPYHDFFGERLVDLAGVASGAAVLDVACGRGAALLPAARRVGRSGQVVGVDLSPQMVTIAAAALADKRLAGEVTVMDAEHLEFADASFDAALCAFGLFFFPDPETAVAEVFRVVRPGGVIAVSTWGQEDERWSWEDDVLMTLNVERRAVVRPFGASSEVTALLRGAGFTDPTSRLEHHDVRFADEATWWAWLWSYSLRGVLEQQDEATLDKLREEATRQMRPHREASGLPRRLTANLVRARRPDPESAVG